MVRVKICGITSSEDAQLCAQLGAHAIGLNFFPESPRAISPFAAEQIARELPPFVSTVGIFVNWAPEPVIALSRALGLFFAQLHGDETPQVASEIAKKIPIIKALRIGKGSALPAFSKYHGVAAFLLDASRSGDFGGTGELTDWRLAQQAASSQRIILAGGLTPENVADAIIAVRPYAVDVASGVETRPGKKDSGKLRAFFQEVNRANRILTERDLDEVFVGTWELDPATLNYEHGRPGRRAIYVVERIPAGLQFRLDADDADGNPIKVTYGGALDGREIPISGTDAALVFSRLDGNIVESVLLRAGNIADRWTREVLSDKKTMRIIQHGIRPDGRGFRNIGMYRRRK